jgi:hypothetical protein
MERCARLLSYGTCWNVARRSILSKCASTRSNLPKEAVQKALTKFLEIEASPGITFLPVSATEAGFDCELSQRALEKARQALDSIRHFQERTEIQPNGT